MADQSVTPERLIEYFAFLSALAQTKKTNMALAAPALVRIFPELDDNSAGDILMRWWLAKEPVLILTRRDQ